MPAVMSEGMNLVTLLGNLGADPELRQTHAGPVLKMRLATTEVYFDKEQKKQQKTEWHRVTVFGRRAEGLGRFLAKGACVMVKGRLQTSSYEKDGVKHYSTEIIAEDVIPVTNGKSSESTNGMMRRAPEAPSDLAPPF